MALFGLWHGARWTFVLWGLGYGVLISIGQSWRLARTRRGRRVVRRAPGPRAALAVLSWTGTVLVSALLMMLFFSPDLDFSGSYLAALCRPGRPGAGASWAALTALVLLLLFAVHAAGALVDLERAWRRLGPVGRSLVLAGGAAAVLLLRAPVVEPFVSFAF